MVVIITIITMLVTIFKPAVPNLAFLSQSRCMVIEVYIQNLTSMEYTDWLSTILVILTIHSRKQIRSRLPESDVIIEIALTPASFLKI